MTDREAYIVLNLLPGIGAVRVKKMLQVFARPASLLSQSEATLARVPGVGKKLAAIVSNWSAHADLQNELKLATDAGVELVTPADDTYPPILREIYDPPLCLYVRGQLEVLSEAVLARGLAVVGSRRTTHYGEQTTARLTLSAVEVGAVIISGLARGIDTIAHQTTVRAGGITIAVLGGGLGRIYPPENEGLARQICEAGAVISEWPMLFQSDRRSFPMRNRIVSGLAAGTLVVEAGAHSGALITAQQALDQGRMVFAVPGRVDSPQSRGCHQLIKQGARLVETIDDVLEEFSFLPGFGRNRPAAPEQQPALRAQPELFDLSAAQQIIIDQLQGGEMSFDQLASATQLRVPELLDSLLQLELKRHVQQLPGRRYAAKV